MEPFQQGDFETEFLEKKTLIDDKIEDLNNFKFNFNISNPFNSHVCDLKNKIIKTNNKIINHKVNNDKIKTLKTQIDELEKVLIKKNIRKELGKKINSIKSHNNGADFGVIPIDDYSLKYLISANGGCLGISGHNYDVFKCNKNDPTQQFELKRIYNNYAYGKTANNQDYIEDKENIEYPFVMAKSVVSENCLTNNNNNIRIMPCNMLKSQRFEPLESGTCR